MKINIGKKKKRKETSDFAEPPQHLKNQIKKKLKEIADEEDEDTGDGDWAITDVKKVRDQLAFQSRQSGANRPPELFLKDGETKRIRFRDNDPIAGIFQYSCRTNGQWGSYTMPADGKKNLFAKAGLKAGLKVVYEVIDVDGYVDKKGKRQVNVPKFFRVSSRLNEQIEAIKAKRGGLFGYVMDISRRGSDTSTTYTLIPDLPSKTPKEVLKLPRLKPKFRDYYAPLSAKDQRGVVGMIDEEA